MNERTKEEEEEEDDFRLKVANTLIYTLKVHKIYTNKKK